MKLKTDKFYLNWILLSITLAIVFFFIFIYAIGFATKATFTGAVGDNDNYYEKEITSTVLYKGFGMTFGSFEKNSSSSDDWLTTYGIGDISNKLYPFVGILISAIVFLVLAFIVAIVVVKTNKNNGYVGGVIALLLITSTIMIFASYILFIVLTNDINYNVQAQNNSEYESDIKVTVGWQTHLMLVLVVFLIVGSYFSTTYFLKQIKVNNNNINEMR